MHLRSDRKPPDKSSGGDTVIEFILVCAFIAAAVVAWLKGKRTSTIVLFFLTAGYGWLVTASRLAKPGSWWYQNQYDADKRALADARYSDLAPESEPEPTKASLLRDRKQLKNQLVEIEARLEVEGWMDVEA